jgi:hypothetical protein
MSITSRSFVRELQSANILKQVLSKLVSPKFNLFGTNHCIRYVTFYVNNRLTEMWKIIPNSIILNEASALLQDLDFL